jgi:pimeloyl-ACP methyl ester carboxylesterase
MSLFYNGDMKKTYITFHISRSLLLIIIGITLSSIFISLPHYTRAAILVDQVISQSEVWTKESGPYHVSADVAIVKGVKVTIMPGTEIIIDSPEEISFRVEGELYAQGSEQDPVVFHGALHSPTWSLSVATQGVLNMQHTVLEDISAGIFEEKGSIVLDRVYVGRNDFGIMGSGGSIVISSSTIDTSHRGALMLDSHASAYLNNVEIKPAQYAATIQIQHSSLTGNNVNIVNGVRDDVEGPFTIGIQGLDSTITMSSSTLQNLSLGMGIIRGNSSVDTSNIKMNGTGIRFDPGFSPVLANRRNSSSFGIGGLNAETESTSSSSVGFVATGNNILANDVAVMNVGIVPIQASHNWWGSNDGPVVEPIAPLTSSEDIDVGKAGNKIYGDVVVNPWEIHASTTTATTTPCCSSVIFLPGIQASRLYEEMNDVIRGTTTKKLWEPLSNTSVRKLFFNHMSSSTEVESWQSRKYISALQAIGTLPVVGTPIYQPLFSLLSTMVQGGTIQEAYIAPYDWRYGIDTLVHKDMHATSAVKISFIELIKDVAARSRTGKVSIVAHSTGGLIGAYAITELMNAGLGSIIDSFVTLGAPFHGAPKALFSLLHGFDQSILGGLVLSSSVARSLGDTIPGAFGLLPDTAYASGTPVLQTYADTPSTLGHTAYAPLSSLAQAAAFARDDKNVRIAPAATNTLMAAVLPAALWHNFENIRMRLNSLAWLAVRRLHLVGEGIPTPTSLLYERGMRPCSVSERISRGIMDFSAECTEPEIRHTVMYDTRGDGTVPVVGTHIEDAGASTTIYVLLGATSTRGISHQSIASAQPVLDMVKEVLSTTTPASEVAQTIISRGYNEGIFSRTSRSQQEPSFIRVSMHSPATLHVYDSKGNHTGVASSSVAIERSLAMGGMIDTPEEDSLDTEEENPRYTENSIPGSFIETIGDRFSIYLPQKASENLEQSHSSEVYNIVTHATDFGSFTLSVDTQQGTRVIPVASYDDVLATPTTDAQLTLSLGGNTHLNASTTPLKLDVNGSGVYDISIISRAPFASTTVGTSSALAYLYSIQTLVQKYPFSVANKNSINKQLEKAKKNIEKGKLKQGIGVLKKLARSLDNKHRYKSAEEVYRDSLTQLINQFINS